MGQQWLFKNTGVRSPLPQLPRYRRKPHVKEHDCIDYFQDEILGRVHLPSYGMAQLTGFAAIVLEATGCGAITIDNLLGLASDLEDMLEPLPEDSAYLFING
jgi:hypothetical protein